MSVLDDIGIKAGKVKPASWMHTPPTGSCGDPCRAARASLRLYGENGHAVSRSQIAKQHRIDKSKLNISRMVGMSPPEPSPEALADRAVMADVLGIALKQMTPSAPHAATQDIIKRFSMHSLDQQQATRSMRLRSNITGLAHLFSENLSEGREKSLAITHLEEALFWANASIAREGK